MDLFFAFLLIGLFLLLFTINIKLLSQAFIVFLSILFLVTGVFILFEGDQIFSTSSLDTYVYVPQSPAHSELEISTITKTNISNTSPFIEVLGLFSILSAIYIFLLGSFKEK